MITQANSSVARMVYPNKTSEQKEVRPNATLSNNTTDRVEKLKSSINAGEYKIDLQALSEKIADSLL